MVHKMYPLAFTTQRPGKAQLGTFVSWSAFWSTMRERLEHEVLLWSRPPR